MLGWHIPIKVYWEKVKANNIVLYSALYTYEKILRYPPLLPFHFTTSLRFSNELEKCCMLGQGLNIKNEKFFFPSLILITRGFIFLFSLYVRMTLLSHFWPVCWHSSFISQSTHNLIFTFHRESFHPLLPAKADLWTELNIGLLQVFPVFAMVSIP